MSAVPDPAAIAKLANEFFAALPGAASPANAALSSPSPNAAEPIPVAPPGVPDYPREMFSFPAVPNAGVPQPPSSPTSALNESDFRAIAASLAARCHSLPSQGRCSAGGGARLFVVCRRGERRAVGRCAADSARSGDVFLPWRSGSACFASDRAAERLGFGRSSLFAGS